MGVDGSAWAGGGERGGKLPGDAGRNRVDFSTPCIRWIRRMTESVLLARLEFFGSEAKDERGLGKTLRRAKPWFFSLGVVF